MRIDNSRSLSFFLFNVCPTSAQLQCFPHPFVNVSAFITVHWETALDLEYSTVQVKIEEKILLSVSVLGLCFLF